MDFQLNPPLLLQGLAVMGSPDKTTVTQCKGRLLVVGWRMWSLLGTDNDPPVDSLRMIIDLETKGANLNLINRNSIKPYHRRGRSHSSQLHHDRLQ